MKTKQKGRNLFKKQVRRVAGQSMKFKTEFISVALHKTPAIMRALLRISRNSETRKEAVEQAILLAAEM